jgi:Ca2+-binding RTX toxin-like protein
MSLIKQASTDANPTTPVGTSGSDTLLGTALNESIHGGSGDDVIHGRAGDDRLYGDNGNDVIYGDDGRDVLMGGAGADTFVFTNIHDSYQGGPYSYSDLILDFSSDDRIDVSALGFSGVGDGHKGTLAVEVNDAGTRTYLRSNAYDEGGDRFQLAFEGDVSQYLTEKSIIGNGGSDVIISAPGGQALKGGAGADTFVYNNITDSYQRDGLSQSDLIKDFSDSDRIDLSALGFTGLGNGHDHTLRIEVDDASARTYLKSYDADESGSRFQVSFKGDVSQYLAGDGIVFASTGATASNDHTAAPAPTGDAVAIDLLGITEHSASSAA